MYCIISSESKYNMYKQAYHHTNTDLFPVISLIGHNQKSTIIEEIAEEVLQTTRHSSHIYRKHFYSHACCFE